MGEDLDRITNQELLRYAAIRASMEPDRLPPDAGVWKKEGDAHPGTTKTVSGTAKPSTMPTSGSKATKNVGNAAPSSASSKRPRATTVMGKARAIEAPRGSGQTEEPYTASIHGDETESRQDAEPYEDQRYEEAPPEVYRQLRSKYKALPKGPEKTYGVVEGEYGGKRYKYDRYAGAEQMGFRTDRSKGPVWNYFSRVLQAATGQPQVVRMERERAKLMGERQREYDDTLAYRHAALRLQDEENAQRATAIEDARKDTRARSQAEAERGAASLLLQRERLEQSKQPTPESPTRAESNRALADLYKAQAEAIRSGRTKSGGAAKTDKPPETQVQAAQEADAIETAIMENNQSVAALNAEIAPSGFGKLRQGLPMVGGRKPVNITRNGRPYQVSPDQIEAQRDRLADETEYLMKRSGKLRKYMSTGIWEHEPAITEVDGTTRSITTDEEDDSTQMEPEENNDTPAYEPGDPNYPKDLEPEADMTPWDPVQEAAARQLMGRTSSPGPMTPRGNIQTPQAPGGSSYATQVLHSVLRDMASRGADVNDPEIQRAALIETRRILSGSR